MKAILTIYINKHRLAGARICGDCYFVCGKTFPLLIVNGISLSLSFCVCLKKEISSLGQTPLSQRFVMPCVFFPNVYFILSLLNTSLIPDLFRLQWSRISNPPNSTVGFVSCSAEIM